MKKLVSVTIAVLAAIAVNAQEKSEPPKPRPPMKSVRIEVVLSRYQGDRKISSRPYTMSLGTGKQGTIRVGTEVPVVVTTFNANKDMPGFTPMSSFQYKNVGINMECTVTVLEDGRYALDPIAAEDSSLFESDTVQPTQKPLEAPIFRTRTMRGTVVVRDGETTTFYSAIEPATGELIKGEVTLHVVK